MDSDSEVWNQPRNYSLLWYICNLMVQPDLRQTIRKHWTVFSVFEAENWSVKRFCTKAFLWGNTLTQEAVLNWYRLPSCWLHYQKSYFTPRLEVSAFSLFQGRDCLISQLITPTEHKAGDDARAVVASTFITGAVIRQSCQTPNERLLVNSQFNTCGMCRLGQIGLYLLEGVGVLGQAANPGHEKA